MNPYKTTISDSVKENILKERYYLRDAEGSIIENTPEELFMRVATHVVHTAAINDHKDNTGAIGNSTLNLNTPANNEMIMKFYDMMNNLDFLPNTPTLANSGKEFASLSACFVVGLNEEFVTDKEMFIRSILNGVKNMALIHKQGGGTGFNFDYASYKDVEDEPFKFDEEIVQLLDETHPDYEEYKNSPHYVNPNMAKLYKNMAFKIQDNMASIFNMNNIILANKKTIIDWSNVRCKGSRITTTGGTSCGPVTFMKVWQASAEYASKSHITPIDTIRLFDIATSTVVQGSVMRRGANMGVLSYTSEYIKDFIACKENNDDINAFNLSVGVDGEFFTNPEYADIVQMISEYAWKNGEPGMLFLDRINDTNKTPHKISSTNPCVAGDTPIYTNEGNVQIKDRVGLPTTIWNGTEWSDVIPEVTGKNQKMVRIVLASGLYLDSTLYHTYINENYTKIPASELSIGDKLAPTTLPLLTERISTSVNNKTSLRFVNTSSGVTADTKLAYTQGFYAGDLFIRDYKRYNDDVIIRLVGSDEQRAIEYLYHDSIQIVNDVITDLSVIYGDQLYDRPYTYNSRGRLDWLEGYFDSMRSTVTVDSLGGFGVGSLYPDMLSVVQKVISSLGCPSSLSEDSLYVSHEYSPILLNQGFNPHFITIPGERNRNINTALNNTVVDIIPLPDAEYVYCFNEPKSHSGVFNGILTGNCGEQPLLPFESCNLGSINLLNHLNIQSSDRITGSSTIELDAYKLGKTTRLAVNFLNTVIDANHFPLSIIDKKTKEYRKIGLGVMGFADVLYAMGIEYGSDECCELIEEIMTIITEAANEESISLGKLKGPFAGELADEYKYTELATRRNIELTTIAPTGSISLIANTSSGIEPNFAIKFIRRTADGKMMTILNPVFEKYISERYGADDAIEIMNYLEENDDLSNCPVITDKVKNIFKISTQLTSDEHVRVMETFQKYVDAAISKTITLPEDCTVEDVKKCFQDAHDHHCKGITIYRNNSRQSQVLITTKDVKKYDMEEFVDKSIEESKAEWTPGEVNPVEAMADIDMNIVERVHNDPLKIMKPPIFMERMPSFIHSVHDEHSYLDTEIKPEEDRVNRSNRESGRYIVGDPHPLFMEKPPSILDTEIKPEEVHKCNCGGNCSNNAKKDRGFILQGRTYKYRTGCGNLYIVINHDENGKIVEVATLEPKGGGCSSQSSAVTRLLSVALQKGHSIDDYLEQLRGIRCSSAIKNPNSQCLSCPDAIGKAIQSELDYINTTKVNKDSVVEPNRIGGPTMTINKVTNTKTGEVIYDKNEKNTYTAKEIQDLVVCPECGGTLMPGHCKICVNCAWKACND